MEDSFIDDILGGSPNGENDSWLDNIIGDVDVVGSGRKEDTDVKPDLNDRQSKRILPLNGRPLNGRERPKRKRKSSRLEEEEALSASREIVVSNVQTLATPISNVEFPDASLQAIVTQYSLGKTIDLRELTIRIRIAEYHPLKMNAAIIRWPNPRVSFRIFLSGRVLLLGSKDLGEAKQVAKVCCKMIMKAVDPEVRFLNFKQITCVGRFSCGFPVRVTRLAEEQKEFVTYEPELSSALIYRFPKDDSRKINHTPTILVFVTGNCVVSGCVDMDGVQKVVERIYPVLRQYRTIDKEDDGAFIDM